MKGKRAFEIFSKKTKKVLDKPLLGLYNMLGFTKPMSKGGEQLPEKDRP